MWTGETNIKGPKGDKGDKGDTGSPGAPGSGSPGTIIPLVESGTGAVGVSTNFSREDHVHPLGPGGGAAVFIGIDPPPTPTVGQVWWESDTGIAYIYYNDGTSSQWVAMLGVVASDPKKVNKAGDTMTGPLTVSLDTPQLILNRINDNGAYLHAQKNGLPRWVWQMGTGPDTGTKTGSDMVLWRYDNAGAAIDSPFQVSRDTGLVRLAADPVAPLDAATKKYVDDHDTNLAANMMVRFDTPQGLNAGQQLQARQNIYAAPFDAMAYNGIQLNGGFQVSQELGLTGTGLVNGAAWKYFCDGWTAGFNNSTAAFSAGVADAGLNAIGLPGGGYISLANYGYVSSTSPMTSIAASDYVAFRQSIEGYRMAGLGWGTVAAQPVTIGFWVFTPIPGTVCVGLKNGNFDRSYVANAVTSTASWEYKTVTIPGDTTGTWPRTNGVGAYLTFTFASGATFKAPAANAWAAGNFFSTPQQGNFFGANGTVYIAGVTVIPGTQAPSDARSPLIMRPYDQELLLCQRYLYRIPASTFYAPGMLRAGGAFSYHTMTLQAPMRATPTISGSGNVGYSGDTNASINTLSPTGGTVSNTLQIAAAFSASLGAAGDACMLFAGPSGFANFDARL